MRKTYLKPLMMVTIMETNTFVCASQDITGSEGYDIGYGGVDEEGSLDPSSRRRRDVWEDEEEEEDS